MDKEFFVLDGNEFGITGLDQTKLLDPEEAAFKYSEMITSEDYTYVGLYRIKDGKIIQIKEYHNE